MDIRTLLFLIYLWLINYLSRGNKVYMIESTLMNEKHYDIEGLKIHVSPSNQHRILIMDKAFYENKKHVGDADFTFWRGSDKVKFCDLYLEKEGIFFHPQLPQFHNVTIHMARAFLQKMKDDIPKLYNDNIMLTWLSPYKTAHQLNTMKEGFPLYLLAVKKQYEHHPLTIAQTTEEIFNEQFLASMKDAETHEKPPKDFEETKSEILKLIGGDSK